MANKRYKLVLQTLVVVAVYLLLPNYGISQNVDSSNYVFISRSMLPSEKKITDTILQHATKINGSISFLIKDRIIEEAGMFSLWLEEYVELDFKGMLLFYIYTEKSVDSLIFSKGMITIYAAPISFERNFVHDGYCDTFLYNIFTYLYTTFFKYPEVNALQIFIDHVPSTGFPVKSDAIIIPEGNIMYKDWYVHGVDYDALFFELFKSEGKGRDYKMLNDRLVVETKDILKVIEKIKNQ